MKNEKIVFLMIGNSRLHWGFLNKNNLRETWDTEHLATNINKNFIKKYFPNTLELNQFIQGNIPFFIASVVPSQLQFFQDFSNVNIIKLDDIPIKNIYPTMGIDRALALWGAIKKYGYPCLVIDGGTALTLTGVNNKKELVGGAILPGLKLQQKALAIHTAALPHISLSHSLPSRWAMNTNEAIESGITYTILAGITDFIEDWYEQYSNSYILLTGGDRNYLFTNLINYKPSFQDKLIEDKNLIFWGMKHLSKN